VSDQYTVSNYVIDRLLDIGVRHAFGVPGDYVLDFLDHVVASDLQWVGTCNELNAGYAADGYARMNGAGAAVVTYGVGGLSILNALAGAYAEQVPLVLISGAPPARRRQAGALVHHLISSYYLQLDICKKITGDAAILTDPATAPEQIDRVLAVCVARKLPVYFELPADVAVAPCRRPGEFTHEAPAESDEDSLAECLAEVAGLVDGAEHPLILAGVDLLRIGLGQEALALVETTEIPFATMLSSKSVLPELHPQFIGIYQGAWSREAVRREVEESDCVLSLGVRQTDLDTGLFSAVLDGPRIVSAGNGEVRIGHHYYRRVQLGDLMRGLAAAVKPRSYLRSHPAERHHVARPFVPEPDRDLTAARLYEALDYFLEDDMVLLAEPGDAFCAAPEFHIEEAENFIVQVYYSSIGFCTPASLGVALACPSKRPVVLTGDGAFQMTAQEVSTLVRRRLPALIVVINNDGYLVERKLHEDGAYNDIQMWQYARLPEVLGDGSFVVGRRARTEQELLAALKTAAANADKLVLIEACIPGRDCSAGLDRLGQSFRAAQPAKK
jgi:TPP-dependent 2-oxoacid decarboxylase